MFQLLQNLAQQVFAGIAGFVLALGGLVTNPRVITITPTETATISHIVAATPPPAEPFASSSGELITTSSASLQKPTSTPTLSVATKTQNAQAISVATKTLPVATPSQLQVVPPPPPVLQPITAQSFLEATTLSLKPAYGGTYTAALDTTISGERLSWTLGAQTLGGTGLVPKFTVAFLCDPPTDAPANTADHNQIFTVRTAYRCTVSLTPTTGDDRRTQNKLFSFETGGGFLTVQRAPVMDTVLKNDKNTGGFVFINQDTLPLTVNGLMLDIAYTGLNADTRNPLVLRFLEPGSEQTLLEHHLETIPEDLGKQFSHTQNGLTLPITFTIEPASQKMLPVHLLGVRKMSVLGINPTVTIALRETKINRGDVKTVLNSAALSWMCIVSFESFNPNATSGPYVSGTVCRD
jgi:hypothetical protein